MYKRQLDYDESGLDAAYDQRVWAHNIPQVRERISERAAEARAAVGEPERHAYGSSAMEGLDWYRGDPGGPIHVHLHGGAWRNGRSGPQIYMADLTVDTGAHCVIPDYVKVGDTGGDLLPLGEQSRRAVAWVYENAEQFGADPDRIVLSGHSAGGHLAGVALTTEWSTYGLPTDVVKKGLCVSGMFDLYPVSLSSRNEYVAFNDDTVESLSPIRHLEHLSAEIVVAVGTRESPEFQRQSRDFHEAVEQAGKNTQLIVADGLNHFEMVLDLGSRDGIVRAQLNRLLGQV